ncbi:MAG: hypothetical protein APR53_09050 [Methanoculleus sp. SDB]|nr:MAG: hypothetical protein APR53_09050 [Methanoculleus sp. SDB]
MGLLREGINEVIATTHRNAAPIGFICRDGRVSLVLFHGSHTEENVREHGWIVANIVFDPVLYVRTAFTDLPPSAFVTETVAGISVERLREAEAWAAFSIAEARDTGEALVVRLHPLHEEIIAPVVRPVNRGFSAIIEATVHATRYIFSRDSALKTLIDHHAALARKCGGPREWEALDLLQDFIGKALTADEKETA